MPIPIERVNFFVFIFPLYPVFFYIQTKMGKPKLPHCKLYQSKSLLDSYCDVLYMHVCFKILDLISNSDELSILNRIFLWLKFTVDYNISLYTDNTVLRECKLNNSMISCSSRIIACFSFLIKRNLIKRNTERSNSRAGTSITCSSTSALVDNKVTQRRVINCCSTVKFTCCTSLSQTPDIILNQ